MPELKMAKGDYNLEVARLRLPKHVGREIAIRNISRVLLDHMLTDYSSIDWWAIAAYAEKFSDEAPLPESIYHAPSTIWFAVANVINDVHSTYWWGQLYGAARIFGEASD